VACSTIQCCSCLGWSEIAVMGSMAVPHIHRRSAFSCGCLDSHSVLHSSGCRCRPGILSAPILKVLQPGAVNGAPLVVPRGAVSVTG
jgi:hypothetical protein